MKFKQVKESNEVVEVLGVRGYVDENNVAQLNLEDCARGLGFTTVATSGNVCVRWNRVRGYLDVLGVAFCGDDTPEFIPENIFYRLAMKASNEAAEKFQAKVADEILPSIRKHGAYMTADVIEKTLTDPDFLIRLATQLKEEKKLRILAEAKVEEQKPAVVYTEKCLKVGSKNLLLVREVAKLASDKGYKIGQNRLYDKLRDWKLIIRGKTEPTQKAVDAGYFEVIQSVVERNGSDLTTYTTKVTPKGQVYIINKLMEEWK